MVEKKGKLKRDKKEDSKEEVKGSVNFTHATPAVVEELIGNAGNRGGVQQVRCKILDGRDKNKILRRNVRGPVREQDILMLRETEIEARKLNQTRRGSS
jgi:small subunit ribosomal protein S28e